MQDCFNICKSINRIHHINKRQDKNHMVLTVDAENTFDKIQYPFLIKTLKKVGIGESYLKIIKTIYERPTTNIILNGGKPRALLLRSGTQQGCPHSPLCCPYHHYISNIVLEVLASASRQHKGIKGIHISKEEVKISLFIDDMIIYVESPKIPPEDY